MNILSRFHNVRFRSMVKVFCLGFSLLIAYSMNVFAQNTVFSAVFTNGVTPPVPHPQWQTFLSELTPGVYVKMTISGTYDMTGITCTDPVITNAFANALKNHLDYISPLVDGHVWSVCNRYGGEVWLDPPALCSGSNCPDPGYLIRAEIGNMNWGGVNTATCTSNPTQTMTLTFHKPSAPNDAGISSLDSPKDFCAGTHDVRVTLENFGTNQISSVTINWKLNGVTQTPVSWTGFLDTLTANSRKTQVTLATMPFAGGIPYTFQIWTTNPNGVPDTVNNNDTVTVTRSAALDPGTYTIGGSSPDYPTIAAAVAALNANGICGAVVYNIRNGTYPTSVTLGNISGASAINTVTFQSESGNKGDVTLTNNATSTTNNFVIEFNGAKFVTFKNLTMTATNASYSTVVQVTGTSTDNTIENCELIGMPGTTTSTYNIVVYSPSGTGNQDRHSFLNCGIRNGSYGFYLYGSSTTSTMNGTRIEDCEITGQYYMPAYLYAQGELKFIGNTVIQNSAYTTKYAVYTLYGVSSVYERNRIFIDGGSTCYGMYVYYDNNYQTGNSRIVNNMVTVRNITGTCYGINHYYGNNALFAHNTVLNESPYTSGYAVYTYYGSNHSYLNNIFVHTGGGYAWYVAPGTNVSQADYNNLFSTGTYVGYWNAAQTNLAAFQVASGMNQHSVSIPVSFADPFSGDLHLIAPSDDDDNLIGILLPTVTDDIDEEPRVRPYMGADEACYLIANSLSYEFVNESGTPIGFVELPGTVGVHYQVVFPEFDATVSMTANFYSVPDNQLIYSETFTANKGHGVPLDGISYFNLPGSLPSGYYKVELVFHTKNSCGYYRDYMPYPSSLLLVPVGATPCEVWPGDVNNDGVVNYTDRKDLNDYIHDANLSSLWLTGPARYRADAEQNPLTYLQWQPQAGAPWFTAEGCYMDTDGNGVVNNYDYLAIKLNWMRLHGGGGVVVRMNDGFTPTTFDMSQNYPNPFNPTTTLQYSNPEASRVHLRITDMLGRVVATAVDGIVEPGVHQYVFDASELPSGQYIAIVNMTGNDSGLSFSKTVKMTLNK